MTRILSLSSLYIALGGTNDCRIINWELFGRQRWSTLRIVSIGTKKTLTTTGDNRPRFEPSVSTRTAVTVWKGSSPVLLPYSSSGTGPEASVSSVSLPAVSNLIAPGQDNGGRHQKFQIGNVITYCFGQSWGGGGKARLFPPTGTAHLHTYTTHLSGTCLSVLITC
jgi:hypothetical protein